MKTLAVGDRKAALKRLREEVEPFDLIILDVMFPPGMDGINVCREIRTGEAGSASSSVPIVMLTVRDEITGRKLKV